MSGIIWACFTLPTLSLHVNRRYSLYIQQNFSQYLYSERRKKKRSPKAQTMPGTSFGPVFVVLHLPALSHLRTSQIQAVYKIKHSLVRRRKKKTHLGPNDTRHLVWAQFLSMPPILFCYEVVVVMAIIIVIVAAVMAVICCSSCCCHHEMQTWMSLQ